MNHECIALNRNLIHATGLLLDPPVAGQWQAETMQQQDTVDAVVPYEDDRPIGRGNARAKSNRRAHGERG